ncbi:MAG: Uma2 family endonuclease [Acidobacteriota bacterium]|nr:Uma2 family endonuclease [Acidobacteriota bacterium]
MSVNVSTINQQGIYPPRVTDKEVFYPDTDESIMPEGILHFLLSVRLTSMLLAFFANREDVKIFGNVMLYYEQGFPKKFISPDLMICFGLKESPTSVYRLWETKVVPSVVIEFASETTWLNDVSSKLAIYQKLGVKEYYVYEVDSKHLPSSLIVYRLDEGVLTEVEISNKRILSESLGLELIDTGETLRFINPETNEFLMTVEEVQAENEKLKERLAELEKQNEGK